MPEFLVSHDETHDVAYIYFTPPFEGQVESSVELDREEGDPETLDSLVLDFDAEGHLVGIEVIGHVRKVLPPQVLDMPPRTHG